MITISLCMIVKNEEDNLARCLESVGGIADEIIIVDTGSDDRTKEIAGKFTNKIYDFEWIDDFSAARNYAFSKAACEYWMWLDADDILSERDREAFLEFRNGSESDFDVAMMRYNTAFDEAGNPTFSYYRERLIRRGAELPWNGAVHEVIAPFGRIIYLEIAVTHKKNRPGDADRNLLIYERRLEKGFGFSPRELYYYSRELYYHKRYEAAAENLRRFIEMDDAWLENRIEACQILAYCLYNLGDGSGALRALFLSFGFDRPRAEVCCDVGKHFFDRGRYDIAEYWYERAAEMSLDAGSSGFRQPECYDFIPYLQLCVCRYRSGDVEKAAYYNEKAGEAKPDSEAYLINKKLFASLKADNDIGI